MTDRIEIISKTIDGQVFTGIRFYLELPVTLKDVSENEPYHPVVKQVRGPFIHHEGDDDSSAVTFWGKRDMRDILDKAKDLLDKYYGEPKERE